MGEIDKVVDLTVQGNVVYTIRDKCMVTNVGGDQQSCRSYSTRYARLNCPCFIDLFVINKKCIGISFHT